MLHINHEEMEGGSTAARADYNRLMQKFCFYDFWNIKWKMSAGI